jgi:hypothetical protein
MESPYFNISASMVMNPASGVLIDLTMLPAILSPSPQSHPSVPSGSAFIRSAQATTTITMSVGTTGYSSFRQPGGGPLAKGQPGGSGSRGRGSEGGGGRGGGGGKRGGGVPAGGQAAGGQLPQTMHLYGIIPDIFNGDCDDLQHFCHAFTVFWEMNWDHPSMSNPYLQVLTCVGRIWGKAVNQWVDEIIQPLINGVEMWWQHPNHLLATNPNLEWVWMNFDIAFKNQFENTVAREKAVGQLLSLEMHGEDLKMYINDFNMWLAFAKWEPDN